MKIIWNFTRHMLALPKPVLAWLALLLGVNLVSGVLYLDRPEGKAVLLTLAVAAVLMVTLFVLAGFTRLLGLAHITWFPLLAWLALRLDTLPPGDGLRGWVWAVMAANAVSLVFDVVDVARWLRGERRPIVTLASGG